MTTPSSLNGHVTAPQPAAATAQPAVPATNPLTAAAAAFDFESPEPNYQILDVKPVAAAATTAPPPAVPTPQPATPQVVPATPPPAPASKHPEWLINRANEFGVHPRVVETLDTVSLNQVVMDTMARQLAHRDANLNAAAVTHPAPPGGTDPKVAAAAVATVPPPEPQKPAVDWGMHEDVDDMGQPTGKGKRPFTDKDVYAPIAHALNKLAEKLDAVEKFNMSIANQAVAAREREHDKQFDAAFSDYPELFGKGNADSVKNSDRQAYDRRVVIYKAVTGLFKTLPREIASTMTIKQAVQNMTLTFFGKGPVAAAATPAPQPQHDFTNGVVAHPTQRQPGEAPLGRDRAIGAVNEWWANNRNQGTPQNETTTMDEFWG